MANNIKHKIYKNDKYYGSLEDLLQYLLQYLLEDKIENEISGLITKENLEQTIDNIKEELNVKDNNSYLSYIIRKFCEDRKVCEDTSM